MVLVVRGEPKCRTTSLTASPPDVRRGLPRLKRFLVSGFAPRLGFALVFLGQSPQPRAEPYPLSQLDGAASHASHPAAKPEAAPTF